MEWQKAKFLKHELLPELEYLADRPFWVEAKPPEDQWGISQIDFAPTLYPRAYNSNLLESGVRCLVPADTVELLPEFTNNPPPFIERRDFAKR